MATHLQDKSKTNRDAADLLQSQKHYPSVVHCAYYSCVQLMKHILLNKLGKTETIIDTEQRSAGLNSHQYMINEVIKELKNQRRGFLTFNTNISSLKKLRVQADYKEIIITETAGNNSIKLADDVLKDLKSNFNV